MLVLSRKTDQRIRIGDNITIVVNQIKGNRVTIGIEAPEGVRILRGELQGVADQFEEEDVPPALPARSSPLVISPDTDDLMPGPSGTFVPPQAR